MSCYVAPQPAFWANLPWTTCGDQVMIDLTSTTGSYASSPGITISKSGTWNLVQNPVDIQVFVPAEYEQRKAQFSLFGGVNPCAVSNWIGVSGGPVISASFTINIYDGAEACFNHTGYLTTTEPDCSSAVSECFFLGKPKDIMVFNYVVTVTVNPFYPIPVNSGSSSGTITITIGDNTSTLGAHCSRCGRKQRR